MMVFDTTIGFRIFDAMRIWLRWGNCFQIRMVDTLLKISFIETNFNKPLEASIAYSGMEFLNENIR